MKKTKTGLHIETRKNRIEVYTQKELEAKIKKQQLQKDLILYTSVVVFSFLCALIIYSALL
tara:strand:- start:16 stop:198 length:183 start_codon:yes stop_codon:yes gene_type:complete